MGLSEGFPYNASYRFCNRNTHTASGESTVAIVIIIIIISDLEGTVLKNILWNISTLQSINSDSIMESAIPW